MLFMVVLTLNVSRRYSATSCYLFPLNEYSIGGLTAEDIPPSIRNNKNIFILQRNTTGNKLTMAVSVYFVVWLYIEVPILEVLTDQPVSSGISGAHIKK